VLALGCTLGASAQPLTLSEAINKAGRQRMLTQRIVKYYCLAGLDVNAADARAGLYAAVELFEGQLEELRVFASHGTVKTAIARVDAVWPDFDGIASGSIDREGARRLAAIDDGVLEAADGVVLALEALSERPYARLVNIAGRQRMLSQRMVKLYLLQAWGLGSAATQDQIDRARNEFEGALEALRAAPENTPSIERELDSAQEQWQWLRSALGLYQTDTYFPSIVDDSAEKTLAIMERVTRLYARLYEQRVAGAR
jgi:nitrate/nitrite-specific signal transduction histidine kinase